MLPSKVVNYPGDIDVERPFQPGDLHPLASSLFCWTPLAFSLVVAGCDQPWAVIFTGVIVADGAFVD